MLENKAVLVQLTISQWTARKFDRTATEEVAANHGVAATVGRYNKALLPGAVLLSQINKAAGLIRNDFYKNTLPWGLDGSHILPSENYMKYINTFSQQQSDWYSLVDQFCADYPALVSQAQKTLGPLYDPADYPDPSNIRNKFDMDIAVFPIPKGDFRVALDQAEIDQLEKQVERRVNDAQKAAVQELWQRLYDKVAKLHERIADHKNTFHNSTVENVAEICDMLSRMNVTNDPDLEAMRMKVMMQLTVPAELLRGDPMVRTATAIKADEIMNKMRGFMGA